MKIRFKDFRSAENYGKEIYMTNSLEEARKYMNDHDKEMRFICGGGKKQSGEYTEIYWDIMNR